MTRSLLPILALFVTLTSSTFAQNTNTTQSTQPSPPLPKKSAASAQQETAPATPSTPARAAVAKRPQSPAEAAQIRSVRGAFDKLIDGIRRGDAKAVMEIYWNSPQLVLFNNNGTVTKSWEQVKENRESLYAKVKDVKLDVREVTVRPLGLSAAVVTCLWDQSQTSDGQPERATGRLTIAFQKIGGSWKAVHAHTSPDKPDPTRLLPSERTTPAIPADPAAVKP